MGYSGFIGWGKGYFELLPSINHNHLLVQFFWYLVDVFGSAFPLVFLMILFQVGLWLGVLSFTFRLISHHILRSDHMITGHNDGREAHSPILLWGLRLPAGQTQT